MRRLLDGVGSVAEAVSSVSALPAKTVTSWMSDQIAPNYWTPNLRIKVKNIRCRYRDLILALWLSHLSSKQQVIVSNLVRTFCFDIAFLFAICHLLRAFATSSSNLSHVLYMYLHIIYLHRTSIIVNFFPQVCGECQKEFESAETKHHCRACGGGFCDKCSSKYMAVPWRGWGNIPVRVCLSCYKNVHRQHTLHRHRTSNEEKSNTKVSKGSGVQLAGKNISVGTKPDSDDNVTARYVGEVVQSAIGLMTGAISYPKGFIVESARPDYWVPDANLKSCHKCKDEFGSTDSKHHCRACGEGFCGKCSSRQRPVPSKGWDNPVRVCDLCINRTDL